MRIMLRIFVAMATLPVAIVIVMYAHSWYQLTRPCETTVNIHAAEYWSWVKTGRAVALKQRGKLISGRLADAPQTCWQVESGVLESDDEGRAEGYRRALAYHMNRVQAGEVMGGSGRMITELTGMKFKDKKDAIVWAYQNMDRLVYSKEKDILVVDETPRASIYSQGDISGAVIPAREYWYLDGLRLLGSMRDEDGYRIAEATRKSYGRPDQQVEIRVELAKLDDSNAKIGGYKKGLDELMRSFNATDDEQNAEVMGSLQALTGRSFGDVPEWREWYRAHAGSKWVLTADGNHLAPEDDQN